MLDLIRKHSRSWLIKVLLGTIIVVFIFFYGWSYVERRAGIIALINGTAITVKSFEDVYRNLLENLRQRTKEEIPDETLKELRKVAFEKMVNRILLLQEAQRLKIDVTEEELKEHIKRLPPFQKDGKFDRSQYLRVLHYSKISPKEFEIEEKEQLLISKLENLIMDNIKISDQELYENYSWINEKVSLSFIELDPKMFKNEVHLQRADIEEYFKKNQSKFLLPARIRAEILVFDPAQYRNRIKIDNKEIRELYEWNIDRYRVPERVALRHIFIKISPSDDAQARTRALKKAEDVLERAKRGEDFSRLAKHYSDDEVTSSSGGYLGYVQRGQLLKPIEEAAFSLKKGEVSRIIKSPSGFHIVKVEDIQESKTKSFDEMEPFLREEIIQEKSRELASQDAEKGLMALMEKKSFEMVSKEFKVPIIRTPIFSEGETITGLDVDDQFHKALFKLKANEISEVIESKGKFYIARIIETFPPRLPEFSEVERHVHDIYVDEKAKDITYTKAMKIIERLRNGIALSKFAKELKIPIKETGPLGRLQGGFIPSVGTSEEILQEAFSLTKDNPYPKRPFWVENKCFIFVLKEKIGADRGSFEKEKGKYASQLLQLKRYNAFQDWLQDLKKRAKIERYKAYDLI
jgi:peptidyl-prolyl cis-trans isomerase D